LFRPPGVLEVDGEIRAPVKLRAGCDGDEAARLEVAKADADVQMTVSGWTITSASLHPGQNHRNRTQKIRSDAARRGRECP